MNGINILNKIEIMDYSDTQNTICIVSFVVFVISIGLGLAFIVNNHYRLTVVTIVLFAVSLTTMLKVVREEKSYPTGRYKYEVTIDNTVPFTEVYKKYDVVKQKRDLWVLKDKEDEK